MVEKCPNVDILLEPSRHVEAVLAFKEFFLLSDRPTGLDLLKSILVSFSEFPYENISKIIKYRRHFGEAERIRLPWEVMEGHAEHRLGGTCFSLTYFLQTILSREGFSCYPVMADMRWGENVHCALVVTVDSLKYLVDPGYLLSEPMALDSQKPRMYTASFSGVELVFDAERGKYDLYTFDGMQKKWRYRFWDRPVSAEEFYGHWLSSFGWNSMHGLCLTKVEKGGMVYVHKHFMRETSMGVKRNFNIKKDYHETIRAVFGIDPQLVEKALAALEVNMAREREMGLWVPKSQKNTTEQHRTTQNNKEYD
ncbi:MAG: arylamine N-acetyltransferase [bacterium]